MSFTAGELELQADGTKIKKEDFYKHIGVISPYLNFYEGFSAYEILELTARIRGIGKNKIDESLETVALYNRRNDDVRVFSSGMKQRLKFAFALLHQPIILLLDEPTSNLDEEGIEIFEVIINDYYNKGMVIIATNSAYEKALCRRELNLDNISIAKTGFPPSRE